MVGGMTDFTGYRQQRCDDVKRCKAWKKMTFFRKYQQETDL